VQDRAGNNSGTSFTVGITTKLSRYCYYNIGKSALQKLNKNVCWMLQGQTVSSLWNASWNTKVRTGALSLKLQQWQWVGGSCCLLIL